MGYVLMGCSPYVYCLLSSYYVMILYVCYNTVVVMSIGYECWLHHRY